MTEVGRVLLEHAEILLAAERDAQSAVEQVRDTLAVELTVGVFSTVAAGLMPGIVEDLALRHPEVHIRTREFDPDDAGIELRHGHLDLAFLIDYPDATEPWAPGITIVPAIQDELISRSPPAGSPPARCGSPTSQTRTGSFPGHGPTTAAPSEPHATKQASTSGSPTRSTNKPTALAMVAAGLGITLISDLGRTFLPNTGVTFSISPDPCNVNSCSPTPTPPQSDQPSESSWKALDASRDHTRIEDVLVARI